MATKWIKTGSMPELNKITLRVRSSAYPNFAKWLWELPPMTRLDEINKVMEAHFAHKFSEGCESGKSKVTRKRPLTEAEPKTEKVSAVEAGRSSNLDAMGQSANHDVLNSRSHAMLEAKPQETNAQPTPVRPEPTPAVSQQVQRLTPEEIKAPLASHSNSQKPTPITLPTVSTREGNKIQGDKVVEFEGHMPLTTPPQAQDVSNTIPPEQREFTMEDIEAMRALVRNAIGD